jgi:hypothetical protein
MDSNPLFGSPNHAFISHLLLSAKSYSRKPEPYIKFQSRKRKDKEGVRLKMGNIILPHIQVVF